MALKLVAVLCLIVGLCEGNSPREDVFSKFESLRSEIGMLEDQVEEYSAEKNESIQLLAEDATKETADENDPNYRYKCGFEDDCKEDFKVDTESPNLKWSMIEMGRNQANDRTEPFGHYMYAEIKQNNKKNEYTSFNHKFTVQKSEQCGEFYYHMYNREDCDVARLLVTLECEGSDQTEILMRETGNKVNDWVRAQIPIKKAAGSKCKLTWRVSKGLSDQGKVYIDDISMYYSPCRSDNQPQDPSEADCSFNYNTCQWKVNGKLSWHYTSWGTKTQNTGPDRYFPGIHSRHKAGRYAYLSAKERSADFQEVSLESPAIKSQVDQCMRYAYNMYGKDNGSLEVTTAERNQSPKQVLKKSGDQGKEWQEGWIDLPAGKEMKVKMVATVGDGDLSDIALASIKTTPGKCKPLLIDCSTMKCDITNEDCGKEIKEFRQDVVEIKENNHITTLPKIAKEWELSLDIKFVGKVAGWSNILRMAVTDNNCCSKGDRIPAIFVYSNQHRLLITNAVSWSGNSKYNNIYLQYNNFINVKLAQKKEGDKYYYYIYNNGRQMKKEWNRYPTEWKNVKMYTSDSMHPAANVQVKNIVFKNNGKFDQCNPICNKQLSDPAFTSLKPDPPMTFYTSDHKLSKGGNAGTISTIAKEWSVSLEIKPLGVVNGWTSIVSFTANDKNCCGRGDRIPSIFFHHRSTRLLISSQIDWNGNRHHNSDAIPLNQYTKVVIKQEKIGGKYQYTIDVGNKNVFKVENTRPTIWKDVKVYASDPWHSAANAEIRNLEFKNLAIVYPCPNLCKSKEIDVTIDGEAVKGVSFQYEQCKDRPFVYQVTVPKSVRTPRLSCLQFYYKVGAAIKHSLQCVFDIRYLNHRLLYLRPKQSNEWKRVKITVKHYLPYGQTKKIGFSSTVNERCPDIQLAGLKLLDGVCKSD